MFTPPPGTRKRAKLSLAALAFALLAIPTAAQAATISYDSSGGLTYQAAPGEKNYFGASNDGGRISISDSGPGTIEYPGDACEPGWVSYVVLCDMPTSLKASLDDRDDIADGSDTLTIPVTLDGGAGPDTLRHDAFSSRPITLLGGPGDDKVTGGAASDTLEGGDGVDTITGRDAADRIGGGAGDDKLLGDAVNVDPGADVLDGGPGFDTVEGEWQKTTESRDPVNVTLAGGADDGRPGEGDDLRSVEHVVTNIHGVYEGSDAADDFDINQVTVASTLRGHGGDDRLDASDADDTLDGGVGADHLEGGYGNDRLIGGPGPDFLHGDEPAGECSYIYCKPASGNDVIDARDGEVDQVECSVGNDVANVDAKDVVSGCETVNREGEKPGPNDPIATEMTAKFGKVKLRKALKSGVPVTITGPGPGKVAIKARRGKKAVGSGSGKVSARGVARLKLKFTKAGQKALRRAKSAKLTIAVTFKPDGGATVTGRTALTLKR